MKYKLYAIAIIAVTLGATGVAACGNAPKACTAEYVSSLEVSVENASGESVDPERVEVTHQGSGDERTYTADCTRAEEPFGERAGTFEIRASCGDETVTRQVEVTSGDCHVNTESVTLTMPDGACQMCE